MAGHAPRELSATKIPLGTDVLTAARRRISRVFDDFPNIYVSFSGGKDSTVLLELAANEARARGRRIGVLIVDLEAQYEETIKILRIMLARHRDVVDPYWVALPLNLRNAVSHIQPQWMCWDPDAEKYWVRERPEEAIGDENYFDFFHRGMEFEDFVPKFGAWYAEQNGGRLTACLVGIRSDESINRYRTLASARKKKHEGLPWTTWLGGPLYNIYPIYDWRTEDIWRYNGKFDVPYNKIYDYMHQAGVTIHAARLCQPYGDDQRQGLWLYHILEPRTWGRVVARVEGANFGAKYARKTGNILGRVHIEKPENLTWQQYTMYLLKGLPPATATHYLNKFHVFLQWYHTRGYPNGNIPDDGPLNKTQPSWKRMAKCLLTFDYHCKGLSFSPPANLVAYKAYTKRMQRTRAEQGFPQLEARKPKALPAALSKGKRS